MKHVSNGARRLIPFDPTNATRQLYILPPAILSIFINRLGSPRIMMVAWCHWFSGLVPWRLTLFAPSDTHAHDAPRSYRQYKSISGGSIRNSRDRHFAVVQYRKSSSSDSVSSSRLDQTHERCRIRNPAWYVFTHIRKKKSSNGYYQLSLPGLRA